MSSSLYKYCADREALKISVRMRAKSPLENFNEIS
jgi:hypothetical protein